MQWIIEEGVRDIIVTCGEVSLIAKDARYQIIVDDEKGFVAPNDEEVEVNMEFTYEKVEGVDCSEQK